MPKSTRVVSPEGTFQKTTLANGVRVLSESLPGVRSIALGVWIDVGSRDEKPDENGLSHFIEHLVFKGTKNRTALQIANAIESRGGSLNAFTSKEHTCFVARALKSDLENSLDVLIDLATRPKFTAGDIRLEKGVVLEEIKESIDTPSDRIHDNFANTFWGNHSLGQTILGPQDNIEGMSRKRIVDYYKKHYRAGSVIVSATGAISHARLVKLVKEKLDLPSGSSPLSNTPKHIEKKTVALERTKGLQTHLCLGFPGLPYSSSDRAAVMILHALLGGGMSSILFQKIREQLGLVYSVYTFHDFHQDAGLFGAYLGTDKKNVHKAYEMVLAELKKITNRKQSSLRVDEIKNQLKGQFVLGMEGTSSRMSRIARLELMGGEFLSIKQTIISIDRVKSTDLLNLANRIFDEDRMALAVLGPVDAKSFA